MKEKTGALRSDQDRLMFGEGFSFSGYERDPLFLNLGTKKFLDISGVSGIDSLSDGRAGVFADFDNDGDLDVFITTIQNEAHLLFRNNVGQDNNFLRVALEGDAGAGRDAFGAVVRVKTTAGTLTKVKSGGSGFISQHDPRLLFGLGKDEKAQWIEVTWPGGKVERFTGTAAARGTILLNKGHGKIRKVETDAAKLPDPLSRSEAFAKGLKVKVGGAVPDFALEKLGGEKTSLAAVRRPGRKLLINVWATWCLPCAKEMPELEKIRGALAERGIDIVGLNVDTESEADIKGFVGKSGVGYPIFLGGVPAIEQLYATDELTVPLSILIDENGRITRLIPGWSSETQRIFTELAGGPAKP